MTFAVRITSNSTISNFNFSKSDKAISFDVEGESGTRGFCDITIPQSLLGGPYTTKIGNTTIREDYSPPLNWTHAFLYFTYEHSSHRVKITGTSVIPEFPSFLILPLFNLATLLTAIIYRRKHTK